MIPPESIRVSRTPHPQGEADIATIEWCFTSVAENPVTFHRALSWVLDHNTHWYTGQVITFRDYLEDTFTSFREPGRGVEIHASQMRWSATTWLSGGHGDPPWLLRHPEIALPVYEDDALLCCHSSKYKGCEAWESHSCMPTLSTP